MEDHIIWDNCENANNSGLLTPNDIPYKKHSTKTINEHGDDSNDDIMNDKNNDINDIKKRLKKAQQEGDIDHVKNLQRQLSKLEIEIKTTKETKFELERQYILKKGVYATTSDLHNLKIIEEKLNFIIKHMKL